MPNTQAKNNEMVFVYLEMLSQRDVAIGHSLQTIITVSCLLSLKYLLLFGHSRRRA